MLNILKNKKKKSPLPQSDKSNLITSADIPPTQQLPTPTGVSQPSLS